MQTGKNCWVEQIQQIHANIFDEYLQMPCFTKKKRIKLHLSQSGSYPHTSRGSEKASSRVPSNKPEECSGVGNCFTSLVEVLVVAVVEVLVMVVLIVAVVVLVSQSLST